ncbi:MAG: hypothetical protein ACYTF0_09600, partial [Planctomycetota bacterium]
FDAELGWIVSTTWWPHRGWGLALAGLGVTLLVPDLIRMGQQRAVSGHIVEVDVRHLEYGPELAVLFEYQIAAGDLDLQRYPYGATSYGRHLCNQFGQLQAAAQGDQALRMATDLAAAETSVLVYYQPSDPLGTARAYVATDGSGITRASVGLFAVGLAPLISVVAAVWQIMNRRRQRTLASKGDCTCV